MSAVNGINGVNGQVDPTNFKVVIVGAGPAGLLLSLQLARKGIQVTLLDMGITVDDRPRAAHYATPAVRELEKAGILDDVISEGFKPHGVCWRRSNGELLALLDQKVTQKDRMAMVCLPLGMLGALMVRHTKLYPNITIYWDHEVMEISQDEKSAKVVAKSKDGDKTFEGDFVVGCDGANSIVRRKLFGEWNYPGKTWDEWVVATNVYYPFEKFGYIDSNFIIHPDDWYMAAKITKDGLWRVSYGEIPGLTPEEMVARQPMKFERMLPGNPKPDQYKLVNCSPYKMHQRCAEKFRVGRFLLAADAAHLCNPWGGLGLTGGMVDAGNLADCLIGVATGQAKETILDKYCEIRRDMWHKFIDPISSSNIIRMHPENLDHVLEDPFFIMLEEAKKDPEKMKQLVTGIDVIQHDFTQYYEPSPQEIISAAN